MYIPKKYGHSKTDLCPFCERNATTNNSQGIPVCQKHKDKDIKSIRCACGSYLEIKTGKYGAYFSCMNCGNINFKKAMEMNQGANESLPYKQNSALKKEKSAEKERHSERTEYKRKETTITSDEVDLL
jgi:hypothetical protein